MARRNRRCVAILILSLMLSVAPAGAAQPHGAQPAPHAWTWLPQLWERVIERVVPQTWRIKLGPDMDPDGLTATPPPPSSASPTNGDLGPGMDPNGAK
jgi:hypothetical protein